MPPPTVCQVLDLDPELGAGLGASQWEQARAAWRGYVVCVRRGVWQLPAELARDIGRLGLVVVEGILCRELGLGDRHMFELLGPGDVVALPVAGKRHRFGGSISLTAAPGTVVLGLGESFADAAARWPCLLEALLGRLEAQRERLALQGLIAHLPRAEDRVLLALWLLADRWGCPTPEGTVLSLALTHDLLGQLTASRRPTATVAVSTLESRGSIRRLADGSWLVTEPGERDAAALARTKSPAGVLGQSFIVRQQSLEAHHEALALHAQARQVLAQHESRRARQRSGPAAMPAGEAGEREGVPAIDRGEGSASRAAGDQRREAGRRTAAGSAPRRSRTKPR